MHNRDKNTTNHRVFNAEPVIDHIQQMCSHYSSHLDIGRQRCFVYISHVIWLLDQSKAFRFIPANMSLEMKSKPRLVSCFLAPAANSVKPLFTVLKQCISLMNDRNAFLWRIITFLQLKKKDNSLQLKNYRNKKTLQVKCWGSFCRFYKIIRKKRIKNRDCSHFSQELNDPWLF